METHRETESRSSLSRIVLCAGLLVLADRLLFDLELGLNAAIFVTLVTAALLGARVRRRVDGSTRRLALALLGLAASLAVDPGPLAVLLAMAGLTTLGLWVRTGSDSELTVWCGRAGRALALGWTRAFGDFHLIRRQTRDLPWNSVGKGATEWVIPVSFTMVFVCLFAVANPIVGNWVLSSIESMGNLYLNFGEVLTVGRLFFWVAIGSVLWGLLRFRTTGWLAGRVDDQISFREDVARTETVVRCLVLFNAVFAVQTLLDLVVLGTGGGLPAGMTYAEYAHRGAYPLIATALLAGAFVLITFSAGQKAAEDRRARHLVYAWIVQNLVLLVSTVYRLSMYVEVYGLTRWRLATVVWMGLVAVGFAFIAARVLSCRTNGWLIRRNAFALASVLYVSCFIDFDGYIARYNVRNSSLTGGAGPWVDIDYLEGLGVAARPALEELQRALLRRTDLGPELRSQTHQALYRLGQKRDRLILDWRTWSLLVWRC